MNNISLIGNLTRDPESRTTQSGKQVVTINIAVNRKFKREGQPEADYFRIIVFDKIAENCMNYLAKGRKIGVTGHVQTGSYEDNNGVKRNTFDIISNDVEFLTPKNATTVQSNNQGTNYQQNQNSGGYGQNNQNYGQSNTNTSTPGTNPFNNAAGGIDIDSEDLPF